jgi:sorbitol-specific phosphotransferase system component IIBC
MKKTIIALLLGSAKLLILSLICNFVYDWNDLSKVFGPVISYSQWVGIVIISNSLVPNGITNVPKNDE